MDNSQTLTDSSHPHKEYLMQLRGSAEFRGLLEWYRMNRIKQIKPWRKGASIDGYANQSGFVDGEERVLAFLEGTKP